MTQSPLIIVGSGLAGLLSACMVADHRPVLVLTKKGLNDCNTEQSQGGIAAVWSKEDRVEEHISDTLKAGANIGNPEAVALMSRRSKEAIKMLISYGVQFDRDNQGDYLLALEGAHSRPRVLHAGGDATGTEIMRALTRVALSHPNITIMEQASLAEIITEDQRVVGVRYYHGKDLTEMTCSDLALCTGGAGQLFQFTSNPVTATGEGIVLAYRAGAQLADLEYFQFHPTGLNLPGKPNFLITEAIRGAGAIVKDENGHAFLKDYDPRGDLASRDIVSRAIFMQMQKTKIFLDPRHLGHNILKRSFPNVFHTCLNYGLNIEEEPIPITPVAHYLMGGIVTDLKGRSTVKGLYVAGEAARTGVHGANRLASNSLLEGATFAMQVAESILMDQKETPEIWSDSTLKKNTPTFDSEPIEETSLTREEFKAAMWEKAGILRDDAGLKALLAILGNPSYVSAEHINREEYEFQNMRLLGKLLAQAALNNRESKGSHYRADYPPTQS